MDTTADSFIIESNKPQTVEEVAPEPTAIEEEVKEPEQIVEEPQTAEEETPKPQGKSRAQKRIEALIQEKHELARKVQELEASKVIKTKELSADDFEDYEDYLEAVAESKPKEVTKEVLPTNDNDLVIEKSMAIFEDAREKYPDFDEKVSDRSLPLTIDLLRVINESDDAGEVAYYLANNPKETKRIAELSQAKMAIEVGKIEIKLSQPKTEPKAPTKKVTQAQDPISPVGGSNSAPKTIYDADSYKEYESMRRDTAKSRGGFV